MLRLFHQKTRIGEQLQEQRYLAAIREFGPSIARFTAGYERDTARQQELLQEVHLALWQSFAGFQEQCSVRTWVYRVAHNVGVSHVQKSLRTTEQHYVPLEDAEDLICEHSDMENTDRQLDLQRLFRLIYQMGPPDREVMLMYLEGIDAASIAEVTGLSARNVATKIHRIKSLLGSRLQAKGVAA